MRRRGGRSEGREGGRGRTARREEGGRKGKGGWGGEVERGRGTKEEWKWSDADYSGAPPRLAKERGSPVVTWRLLMLNKSYSALLKPVGEG